MAYKKKILVLCISILVLMGLTSLSACDFLGYGKTASWKEEVLLHDGSRIVIDRWQKHGGWGEIGQSPISDQKIMFTLPRTARVVTWKDEYSEDIGYCNFYLVALHILNGTPYIITTANKCLSYNKWGRPNPPYIIFKLEGNEWKRIELAELPTEFQNVNLIIDTRNDEKEIVNLGLVYAEKIKKLNNSLTREEYKAIIRTQMRPDAAGVMCEKLVYYKGAWIGPGDSIGRRMMDRSK